MADPAAMLAFLALIESASRGQAKPPAGPPGPPGPPTTFPETAPSTPGTVPPPATPAPVTFSPGPAPAPPVEPGQGVPMPPWPAPPAPSSLPPFPGPGWVPDTPVTPTIAARATYWNAILWDYSLRTVRKPFAQEQLGGQWVTFAAAWHPGDKGPQTYMATEAWRLAGAPPVAPPGPAPTTPTHASAAPPAPFSGPPPLVSPYPGPGAFKSNAAYIQRYQAALSWLASAMQQPSWDPGGVDGKFGAHTSAAVKAFQHAHGLTADGEAGAATAAAIDAATGHAPPAAAAPRPAAAAPAPAPFSGPPPLVSPYPGPGAFKSNAAYIQRYQAALSWLASAMQQPSWDPGGVDGKFGAHTSAAVKAFQHAHGLTADGEAGAATAAAIDAATSSPPAQG